MPTTPIATSTPTSLFRLTTAGSVDDGKSTLIGRLLYELGAIYDDHLASLTKRPTAGGNVDLSLLTDGLKSEREQGITIDVAYKYFSSRQRKYILADAPGHVQYTRNMVTAASLADAAIILVDARHGITEQTRRHTSLLQMLKVRHLVLAINKIDLIGYAEDRITAIAAAFRRLPGMDTHPSLHIVPISALAGINISNPSPHTPWYQGDPLLTLLDRLPAADHRGSDAVAGHLVIQQVVRAPDGRRFATGTIRGGHLALGAAIQLLPTSGQARIQALYSAGRPVNLARSGEAVALSLDRELDLERGAIVAPAQPTGRAWSASTELEAEVIWFDADAWVPGTSYQLRVGPQQANATIAGITAGLDLSTWQWRPTAELQANAIARIRLTLTKPIFVDVDGAAADLGNFILVDARTNRTAAAGIVLSGRRVTAVRERGHVVLPAEFFQVNHGAAAAAVISVLREHGFTVAEQEPNGSVPPILETADHPPPLAN